MRNLLTDGYLRGNYHALSCGQSFQLHTPPPSSGVCFLKVHTGHFILKNPEGRVVADVEEGSFVGIAEFVCGIPLYGFVLQAAGDSEKFSLIQIPAELVEGVSASDSSKELRAGLYRACVMVLLQETRELWRRAYPGTWLTGEQEEQEQDQGQEPWQVDTPNSSNPGQKDPTKAKAAVPPPQPPLQRAAREDAHEMTSRPTDCSAHTHPGPSVAPLGEKPGISGTQLLAREPTPNLMQRPPLALGRTKLQGEAHTHTDTRGRAHTRVRPQEPAPNLLDVPLRPQGGAANEGATRGSGGGEEGNGTGGRSAAAGSRCVCVCVCVCQR